MGEIETFSMKSRETSANVYESGITTLFTVVDLVAEVPFAVAVMVAVVRAVDVVGIPTNRTRFVETFDNVTPDGNPDALKTTLHPDNEYAEKSIG
jgi:hypothetical protein